MAATSRSSYETAAKVINNASRICKALARGVTNADDLVNPFSFLKEHDEWFMFEEYRQRIHRGEV